MKLEKGFKQFLIKTGVFLVLFVGIQMTLLLVQNGALPKEYYFILDQDIGKALLLTALIFFFLSRDKLKTLNEYKFETKTAILSGILSLASFLGYFLLKGFIITNPVSAVEKIWMLYPLKEATLILGTLFLAVAVFGMKFSKMFDKKFKKEMLISIIVFIITLFLIIQFQKLWIYISYIVIHIVYFFLDLTFNPFITYGHGYYSLGLSNFIVGIGKPCSGIDSMLMFIFLYVFIAGYDWKKFNKKKLAIMFIPGLISVFILNIIRIYLLLTIGAFISRDIAIGIFHTSASMVFFLAYFMLFWGLLYKWMQQE